MITLQTIDDPVHAGMDYVWCSEHPSITNLNQSSRIHVANFYLKYWWFQNHESIIGAPFSTSRGWLVSGEGHFLAHEFGHSFIREYVHINNCNDHLMYNVALGNVGTARALRTDDVAYIHRGFVYNNLRQFIDCDTRYNASMYSNDREWDITQNEVWELDKRLYHNLKISPGAVLTIKCKVLLPEDGVIIVEQGGKLIIDGGRIHRANTCKHTQHWAGIAVKGRPNQIQPNPNTTLTSMDGGVVILINNGVIEGAVIGVTTKSHPHWDVPSDRGGLVISDNFTFINNIRGVEFMRYDLPNFSYFKNTNFLTTNQSGKWGVTMWRTNNIYFEGCLFENLIRNGIESWDASFHVTKKNQFTNCTLNGILSGASMPLAGYVRIGLESNSVADRNIFLNNTNGYRGTSNTLTDVVNNNMSNFDFDVAVNGTSQNLVYKNLLAADVAGIQFENTGQYVNRSECNVYNSNIVGINIIGNNQTFTFNKENFHSAYHDLFMEGLSSNPGRILNFQGNTSRSVWNYFSQNLSQQIKTSTATPWNNTVTFNYFHPSVLPPSNLIPLCPLNGTCIPASNFYNFQGLEGDADCQINLPNFSICESRACLDSLRNLIEETESESLTETSHILDELIAKREYTMNEWLENFITQSNWVAAEELIESDLNPLNKRRQVALALWRDQFFKADSLLSVFPKTSLEELQFVAIQEINSQFLSQNNFQLDSTQASILIDIAISDTRESGYAKTLLTLLTGEVIMPRLPNIEGSELFAFSPENVSNISNNVLSVYPNPGDEVLYLQIKDSKLFSNKDFEIHVYELTSGRRVFHNKYTNTPLVTIATSMWAQGAYIINLIESEVGTQLGQHKVIIQR